MTITINGTTGIAGVDGSASTPAVQGSDTNTGVYFGTDLVYIATGGTAAVTVDSGQRTKFPTTIGVGGATPSTSGSGISFPATQSASTDANTLDDYEEGTWTPTFYGLTSAGVGTYASQIGKYTKIGNLVTVTADIQCTSHTGTGNFGVGGLPFTTANVYCSAAIGYITNMTVPASNYPTLRFENSSTNGYLLATPVGGGSSALMALDGSSSMSYTLSYQVA